ncbi:MAG: hypothetical protein HY341_02185, partial [Candidatus Kerfeldbacteria bacterium]|nr:hypothetical protein [Candidatus Kerfeldbacteria bacterium]
VFTIPLIIFAFSWHVFATAPFGTWPLLVGFFTATLSISPAKYARILTRSYLAERKDNPAYNPAVLRDDSRLDASLASVRPGMRGIMSLLKTTSEFPASMNIITVILLLDAFVPIATIAFGVLVVYTALLVARECYVLYRVYRGHEPLDAPADLF